MSVLRETNLVPVDHRLGLPSSFAVESYRFIPEKVDNILILILTNFDFRIPEKGDNVLISMLTNLRIDFHIPEKINIDCGPQSKHRYFDITEVIFNPCKCWNSDFGSRTERSVQREEKFKFTNWQLIFAFVHILHNSCHYMKEA